MIAYTIRCMLLMGQLSLDPAWHVTSIARAGDGLGAPNLPVMVTMTRQVEEGESFALPEDCARLEVLSIINVATVVLPKTLVDGTR